jgi:hypothetical protein
MPTKSHGQKVKHEIWATGGKNPKAKCIQSGVVCIQVLEDVYDIQHLEYGIMYEYVR